eukprot:scaffold100167_cov23-Tisochrysis_lutea.AAC.1
MHMRMINPVRHMFSDAWGIHITGESFISIFARTGETASLLNSRVLTLRGAALNARIGLRRDM